LRNFGAYELPDDQYFIGTYATEQEFYNAGYYEILAVCADLCRNNGIASAITRIMVEYISQTGDTLDCESNQQKWSINWMKNASVRGDSFRRVRNQRITSLVETGSALTLFTQSGQDDPQSNGIGLRLEVIDGTRIKQDPKYPNNLTKPGKKVVNGVEFDEAGREIAFWYMSGKEYKRVEKYNSFGMYNAILERSPEFDRESLTRPMPLIYPAIQPIALLGKLFLNVGRWAKNTSALGFTMGTDKPRDLAAGLGGVNTDGSYKVEDYTKDAIKNTVIKGSVKPDFILVTPPGLETSSISPDGSANYDPIFKHNQRAICSYTGVIEEFLFEATDGKNFAVSKFKATSWIKKVDNWASYLNETDTIIIRQGWEEANRMGLESFNLNETISWGGVSDFSEVDGLKSASAGEKRLRTGVTTVSSEKAAKGRNFTDDTETTAQEIVEIQNICKKYNITLEQYYAYQSRDLSLSKQLIEVEENGESNEKEMKEMEIDK